MNPGNFFAELKRRNVYKVAIAYAIVGWLVIQVTATIVPALHLPESLTTAVVVLILVGFPVALVISWACESTPQGLKCTENVPPEVAAALPTWSRRKFAVFIVGVAVIAAGLLAFQLFRTARSTITSSAENKSIAVLPFVNMSADKNDEYLSDGMTEELINLLARVPGLRVPGRTSCFAFKGKNEEGIFHQIGEQLHVRTVLEGSVRKAGDKLRVTAQLVKVADGYHLWSEDYDGDVKDIFTFQSNVAKRVVDALQMQLGTNETRALTKKPTENPEAYRLYLLGRNEFGKYSEAGWTSSIRYYEQALKLDPNYALAYYLYHARRYDDAMVQVRKTLELDPTSTLAHNLLGRCLLGKGDTAGAIAEFQQGKINITGAWYQGLLGYAYAISGDRAKAEQMLRELEAQAKRQYVNSSAFAAIYLGLGEKEKALDWLDVAYENQESACWLLKVDPIYDSLRNEPRFQALVQKVFRQTQ